MRFGIIGCGTIAQIMHIPYVTELPDLELYALADPATERVTTLGERYNVPHRYESADEMIAERGEELDAVIVLTPPSQHADVVETTLGAEIDTLVEKPLSVSVADADRMVSAAEAADATAMVAYNKRYAPAVEAAREEIAALDRVDKITAYDVDPNHGRNIDEVYDLVDGAVPESVIETTREKQLADSKQVIDSDDDELADDYHWHLEHICHDVNLLRGLFGGVESIDHVDLYADGRYATANLVYEGGRRCTLDSGLSDRKWFEEFVRVDSPTGMIELSFDDPFIRNSPPSVRVKRGTDEIADETRTPSYEESFKREVEHFVACIRGDAEVRTPFEEGRADVRLIADLFRQTQGAPLLGDY
ncbi:Gfo/Idh/MocA family protein [Halomicrobium sp. HM KBTZ05]|uniref:Gfo/Idh/MocA family protein n=1 Tax=Halomicrobium sp. HM KBTZ05 TaxID=3242663 RepID=UPI0035589F9F